MGDRGKHLVQGVLSVVLGGALLLGGRSGIAADLKTVRDRGFLIVAVRENAYPLSFRDGAGQLQGFEIDLAHQLAQVILGDPNAVKFQPVRNLDRLPMVMSGKVDLAIAQVTATTSRRRVVEFSPPYYYDETVLVTRSSAPSQAPEQLLHQRVGVLKGSSAIAALQSISPPIQPMLLSSYGEARRRLDAGEVDAVAIDQMEALAWLKEAPTAYRIVPQAIDRSPLGIVLPKGLQSDDFRQQVNRAVQTLDRQGWLEQRSRQWGLTGTAP